MQDPFRLRAFCQVGAAIGAVLVLGCCGGRGGAAQGRSSEGGSFPLVGGESRSDLLAEYPGSAGFLTEAEELFEAALQAPNNTMRLAVLTQAYEVADAATFERLASIVPTDHDAEEAELLISYWAKVAPERALAHAFQRWEDPAEASAVSAGAFAEWYARERDEASAFLVEYSPSLPMEFWIRGIAEGEEPEPEKVEQLEGLLGALIRAGGEEGSEVAVARGLVARLIASSDPRSAAEWVARQPIGERTALTPVVAGIVVDQSGVLEGLEFATSAFEGRELGAALEVCAGRCQQGEVAVVLPILESVGESGDSDRAFQALARSVAPEDLAMAVQVARRIREPGRREAALAELAAVAPLFEG